jgi:hypothetical protein
MFEKIEHRDLRARSFGTKTPLRLDLGGHKETAGGDGRLDRNFTRAVAPRPPCHILSESSAVSGSVLARNFASLRHARECDDGATSQEGLPPFCKIPLCLLKVIWLKVIWIFVVSKKERRFTFSNLP